MSPTPHLSKWDVKSKLMQPPPSHSQTCGDALLTLVLRGRSLVPPLALHLSALCWVLLLSGWSSSCSVLGYSCLQVIPGLASAILSTSTVGKVWREKRGLVWGTSGSFLSFLAFCLNFTPNYCLVFLEPSVTNDMWRWLCIQIFSLIFLWNTNLFHTCL